MKQSLRDKLDLMAAQRDRLNALLSDPVTAQNPDKLREYSIELSGISGIVEKYEEYVSLDRQMAETAQLLEEDDGEMRALAQAEIDALGNAQQAALNELKILLLPSDPNDNKNVFVEIRAGTGGDEAAIFAGDLCRMYKLYVQNRGWNSETVSQSEGEYGGYKEVILRIIGKGAYSRLKFESGTHRVQRVPKTETQGRIHTSACTVAVLPEADEIDNVPVNPQDLRVDTFRASGAGGQHVNRTDSAVRITHLPSGIVVECQEERSQHQNRAKAMAVLRARLLESEIQKQNEQIAKKRKIMVGSGDRSERIRTYNFPQGRVTDHRINLTLYRLEEITAGGVDQIIDPLITEFQAQQMTESDTVSE